LSPALYNTGNNMLAASVQRTTDTCDQTKPHGRNLGMATIITSASLGFGFNACVLDFCSRDPNAPRRVPQCPVGTFVMRSYTPRRIVRQRTLPVSGELLWQQSRRKLLSHPGAPASAAGAIFFSEPRQPGPNASPATLASIETGQQLEG
jgi:hypothetical protein